MRILVAALDATRAADMRRAALAAGLRCEPGDAVPLANLSSATIDEAHDLAIVACDGDETSALAGIARLHDATDIPVLACGDSSDPMIIRESMRAGASSFLEAAMIDVELPRAIKRLEEAQPARRAIGNVVAVFSPSGGCGVSTTAIHIAGNLAARSQGRVALTEICPPPGDLAHLLDVQPRFNVDQILLNWQRLDADTLQSAAVPHSRGMDVFPQGGFEQKSQRNYAPPAPDAVSCFLKQLRKSYNSIVIDSGHELGDLTARLLSLAELVVLVVRADMLGIRRARWALDWAANQGVPGDRIHPLLGRDAPEDVFSRAQDMLGAPVWRVRSTESDARRRAAKADEPLVDSGEAAAMSPSFSSFAHDIRIAVQNHTV